MGHRKIGTFVLICLLTIVSMINQGAEEGTKDDAPASDDQILPDCWLSTEELDSLLSNMEVSLHSKTNFIQFLSLRSKSKCSTHNRVYSISSKEILCAELSSIS